MDDAIALPRTTTGEQSRLAAIVAEQGPRLRALVRRQVADLAEAEDIVQDTLEELVSASRLIEPIEHLGAWLARVARNRIIDRFRSRAREATWIDSLDDDEPPSGLLLDEWRVSGGSAPELAYANGMLAEELVAALDELPPAQREVFIAHELDGRSFRELAAETGLAVNTLLGRKHAAVRHLRRRLEHTHSEINPKGNTR